jgi:hypothetical protein
MRLDISVEVGLHRAESAGRKPNNEPAPQQQFAHSCKLQPENDFACTKPAGKRHGF